MVSFFSFLSKRIQVNYFGYGKFYKEILVKVLTHPFSAAIILGLLLTLVIFPDRPIIFREMSAYIIAYPLIELMNTILNKKYHIYLHTFSVVIVLYMFLVVISQGTVIYRMILFLIALAETGLILLLIYNLRKNSLFTENQKKYLNILIVVHLVIAVCGLVANITGKITLTEIALNAVFANIFNGIILFLTLVILNGLIAAGIDSREGQKYNTFRKFGEIIKQRSILVLIFFAVFLWFTQMLHAFRLDNYIYASISAFFSYQITLGTASFSLDLVVIFFAVIFFSYFTAQFLRIILEEDVLIRLPLSKGLPHTIAMAVKYILIVAGFLLALNAAGIPMDKLTIILGAFSVGIGFGLQNIFSNMVSGLILLFERPIQLGDTVQVGQLTGDVKSIDLRSSNIRTFDGAEVIVPNGQLISNEVINWTLSDKKRRLEVEVGVAYDSDPELVRRLFMDILTTHPKVLQDPEPLVFFSSFGDSALDFVLVFWIADYSEGRIIKSDVHFKIFSILKENNITIPFPQRDVHIHTEKSELPI
jgi:small-conductance mechanosensitive channel